MYSSTHVLHTNTFPLFLTFFSKPSRLSIMKVLCRCWDNKQLKLPQRPPTLRAYFVTYHQRLLDIKRATTKTRLCLVLRFYAKNHKSLRNIQKGLKETLFETLGTWKLFVTSCIIMQRRDKVMTAVWFHNKDTLICVLIYRQFQLISSKLCGLIKVSYCSCWSGMCNIKRRVKESRISTYKLYFI